MIGLGGSVRRLDPEAVPVVNISGVDSRTGRNHARGLIRASRGPTVLVEYLVLPRESIMDLTFEGFQHLIL